LSYCPLCRQAVDELQFHHWEYESDTGVELCAGCHYWLHGGERATQQRKTAREWGAHEEWEPWTLDWRHDAIRRLLLADLVFISEERYSAFDSAGDYVQYVVDRYNIPALSLLPEWTLERLISGTKPDLFDDEYAEEVEQCKQAARDEGWWSS